MASSLLFRLFLKLYRKKILREAYVGILGREPDAAGLAAYSKSVEQNAELASILAEMSQSEEAWASALKSHAETIVNQLHDALCDGGAHPDDLAEWAERLRATTDVGAAAGDMAQGPAHWRDLARHDPEVLVIAAFKALLGRDPDREGLMTYTKLLAQSGDMTLFLSEVSGSAEHQTRVLERSQALSKAQAATAATPLIDHHALIAAAFQGLLGRKPDADAMAAYTKWLQDTGDVAGFLSEVAQSSEHRKRLLLRRG